jgi:hypothetical protein
MFLQAVMRAENRPASAEYTGCPAIWIARSSALNWDSTDNSKRVSNAIEPRIQGDAREWIRLTDRVGVVQTRRIEDVAQVLEDVEKLTLVHSQSRRPGP